MIRILSSRGGWQRNGSGIRGKLEGDGRKTEGMLSVDGVARECDDVAT